MAILTDQQVLDSMSPEICYIMNERMVPATFQIELGRAGYTSINTFACIVDTKAELRTLLALDFGMNPAEANLAPEEGRARRVLIARVVDSWQTICKRVTDKDAVESDQKARNVPTTMSRQAHIVLRNRFEKDWGKTEDKAFPSNSMIERRFEEIEEGDLKADLLTQISSAEETLEDTAMAILDKDGVLRLRKAQASVPLPTTSEQLRLRMRLLSISFQLASYRHGSKPWLAGYDMNIWQRHVDYILGEDIYSFKDPGSGISPTWTTVLSYEHRIRHEAFKAIMSTGKPLDEALETARRDSSLKERFFSTPMALNAISAKRGWTEEGSAQPWSKHQKTEKGDKGKGGKGKGKTKERKGKTPDGRRFCWKFNNATGCPDKGCTFVHACQRCGDGSHNALSPTCPDRIKKAAAEAAKKHGHQAS